MSSLHRSRISTLSLVVLVLAALVAIGTVVAVSGTGREQLAALPTLWNGFLSWLEDLLS